MNKHNFLLLFSFLFVSLLQGQNEKVSFLNDRTYVSNAIVDVVEPAIDGLLDDAAWDLVDWQGDFTQYNPDDSAAPTYSTQFKVLYDDSFLYIAIRAFDEAPQEIEKRLSRRDGFAGDWVEVNLDTNNDERTAFSFTASAAGVKGDEFISRNGDNWDSSWNPIWYTAASIDAKGWCTEIKIPFSQLKFGNFEEQVWGFQVKRKLFRINEQSLWKRVARDAPGWVSEFGVLRGIFNIKQQKQLEIQPFSVVKYDTYPVEEGNPFKDGDDVSLNAGLDAKIGITNDLTLDVTINPDFGQVEADPGNIALDGFQVFLKEQRPFFVENKNIFNFNVGGGSTNVFYSRRIGRSPQGNVTINSDEDFVDQNQNTPILGAVKFSGKTKNGWSIGLLESVTASQTATIQNGEGEQRTATVEPLTNYLVTRIQKDFNDRNSYVGGIFTAVNRKMEDAFSFEYDSDLGVYVYPDTDEVMDPFESTQNENNLPSSIHESAYSVGLDYKHSWKDRKYYFQGSFIGSKVYGDESAILETQESQGHLFHRADATHVNVDATKTSLSGYGGNFEIGKAGGGNLTYYLGATWFSPELELNDIGFLRNSDEVRQFLGARYRFIKPTDVYRSANISFKQYAILDFEKNFNRLTTELRGFINWKNNWWTEAKTGYTPHKYSNSQLRGGERWREFDGGFANVYFGSDKSKKVDILLGYVVYKEAQDNGAYRKIDFRINIQPSDALSISLRTKFEKETKKTQYVTQEDFEDATKYILADIDRETLSTTLRVNYSINPNLSVQYYAQPFIARGKYKDFNFVTDATAEKFSDRVQLYNTSQIVLEDDDYYIDQNNSGTSDFDFSNPDFAVVQFRSNLVVRWEYIPGSELFFVWSQGASGSGDPTNSISENIDNQVLSGEPDNTFLIKATYRFIL